MLLWTKESELLGYVNNNSIDLWLHDRTGQDLTRWFSRIEEVCNACGFLEDHYAEAAIVFIESEHLALVMREKQQQYLSDSSHTYWLWADFKETIRGTILVAENRRKHHRIQKPVLSRHLPIVIAAPTTDPTLTTVHAEKDGSGSTDADSKKKDGGLVKFVRFCKENPGTALVGAGLTVAGAVVVGPALGIAALNAVGGLSSILQSVGATATAAAAAALAAGGGEDDDGPPPGEDTPP